MRPIVTLRGVSRQYPGGVVALRDVDLDIERGELVAIVGPSGSGKSTLLHVMGTLDRPSAGRVVIDGFDVAELSDDELSALRARRIGFVFQLFHLAPGQIRIQFLAESLLLSGLGGGAGVLLGSGVTAGYASLQGWPTVVPAWFVAGAIAAALLIGAVAGLYPAIRAARLAPTEALATT